MLFARKGALVSIGTRKVKLTGDKGLDYTIDGVKHGIYLHTSDSVLLPKNRKSIVTLTTTAIPADRVLAVKVNNDLYKTASITGPTYIDEFDDGVIVLTVIPREDIHLSEFDYIVKLLVEGAN